MQSMISLFGVEILPLIQNFGVVCCTRLPFEMLEDSFNLFIYALTNFKAESLPLATTWFTLIF